ncbi:aminopeptidase P family protein [Microtetraspora sp. NBRC 13810]|uniref:aminopeptidase P family protein n=1 Tax=Microtetraspora sp. NBRC 13810 TaxID=3030990 RepID=UPI002555D15F|nr:aminopeptidase P family protein [Microtetraspora sp. NBRC 13810]
MPQRIPSIDRNHGDHGRVPDANRCVHVASTGPSSDARTASHDSDFPQKLLEFIRAGWLDRPIEVRPQPAVTHYARRRAALSGAFPGETLIIPTGPTKVRANDTFYRFRPGSDFAYLTGDHDPDGVLILWPSGDGHDALLYTRQRCSRETDEFFRDRDGELWVGRRHTLAEKTTELGIDTTPLAELDTVLARCAQGRTRVLRGLDLRVDAAVPATGTRDRELAAAISELKLVKDEWEIAQLQDAVDATVRGFEVENNHLYTADVTRTLPVSGTFSPLQREVYDIVYASQQAGMEAVKPGVSFADVHLTCMRALAEGLVDLGVLRISADEAMDPASMLYRRWTLHTFGHMLGIDMHDCAAARPERYREGELSEEIDTLCATLNSHQT